MANHEFAHWGPCTGQILPQQESCSSLNQIDANCNGALGCSDPTCIGDLSCNTGCSDGQTRACYTGPSGTENVGICKDGKQTCVNGVWSHACVGQVVPESTENRCDNLDHNCNGLAGCWDAFMWSVENPRSVGSERIRSASLMTVAIASAAPAIRRALASDVCPAVRREKQGFDAVVGGSLVHRRARAIVSTREHVHAAARDGA